MPSVCASRLQHPLNTSIHLLFLYEFATRDLIDANLYLCFEPIIMRKHPGNSFLNQIVCLPACLDGQIVKFGFLILRQMYFHV